MTFKEKIVRLRKIKGLTQDEFASAVGVSRQAVYKWESGQSYPEVAKLLEIKMLFNISIDDLLDDNFEVAMPEKKKRKRTVKTEAAKKETAETVSVAKEEPADVATAEVATAKVEVAHEEAHEEVFPMQEIKEEAPVEQIPKEEENEEVVPAAKKVGFFGRLFGRK